MKKYLSALFLLLFTISASGCTSSTKSTLPFPFPDSVSNMTEQESSANFQTSMNLEEVLSFYQKELTSMGLTERELNTAITDTTFSIVYDGHESGKAIVVQSVALDEKSTNVNIRFEEI